MDRFRRVLCSVAVAGVAVLALAPQSSLASTRSTSMSSTSATSPTPMNVVCVSKATDLMSYVSSPSLCGAHEKAVSLTPGPVFACAYKADFVYLADSSRQCPTRSGWHALSLPPASAPVYFCASKSTDLLVFASRPAKCSRKQFAVVVAASHQPPVLANIETSALPYYAGTPGVPVTSSLTVSSPDASTLAGGTVTITTGLVPSEDDLAFINQNGITGSYNVTTGALTLTGVASLADYQTALRSITYSDSDALGASGERTVSFGVDDGAVSNNLSNVVSRTIDVSPNSPPIAADVSASTDKNTAIDIDVLSSAADPDGDTLTVASVNTAGTLGSVSINPDGTIHYDPNGQFVSLTQGQAATDTFMYDVTDGFQDSNAATVTVTITGLNTMPVLSNIEISPISYQAQDPAVAITDTLTLSDADDSTIGGASVAITSGLSAADDSLQFTNQNGITGSYNASTGVLTMTGDASIADYQAALRSVTFVSNDASTSPAARTVSFTITYSLTAVSNTVSRTIDVAEAS
jgi:VCBS repeat-containing protein